MEQNLRWEDFWHIYKAVTGMEPKYRRDFEEEVESAKSKLIKLFKGTRIEIEKELEISKEEAKFEIRNYLDELWERMERKQTLFASTGTMKEIHETMAFFLRFHISNEDFISGYITEKSPIAVKEIRGVKISKALRMVLKEKNLEQYADFLIQDLSILQQKLKTDNGKVKFVISIEPINFLLASNATTGWSSCHAVNREHAAGNLSYLFDHHTAVAYAYRKTMEFSGVEVPQKIWRQWVFIDIENAVALFQRQYPTEIEIYSKEIRSIVGNAFAEYHNIKPKWKKGNWNEEKDECYYYNEAELAYSDPTDTYIYFKGFSPSKDDWFMTVGEIPLCPVCGGEINVPSQLICSNCAGYVQCAECGRWISEDDANHGADNNLYCDGCFIRYFTNCAHCGEVIWKEDALYNPDEEYVCEDCFKKHCRVCSSCGYVIWKEEAHYIDDDYFVCENCFKKYYTTCTECGEIIKTYDAYYINDDVPLCETCYNEWLKNQKEKKKAVI
ncbi:hypothetical protein THYS13_12770 [Thermoanaerobacter sp. YS13]|uniref:hypothetical protein n=1 Tax=Thermoanaerobacter sp. YS13 TaxID=1511746 RepID=UPI0005739A13|nr:hypothetical protein [Thermoanaerobacter sp. YS13]KHO63165.1 hypothetical protein THYS13_12770 [Thermoanaerobacter sp. YS13]